MIGKIPELKCKINDVECFSLIDTGSQISSLSHDFFLQHFSDCKLNDLSDILNIQSAGGDSLPYIGYFDCEIDIPLSDKDSFKINVPILVVPSTPYNLKVPLLIGTNVLNWLSKYSVKPEIDCLLSAIQIIELTESHLNKSKGIFGFVTAKQNLEIKPYSGIVNMGSAIIDVPICNQIALIQDCDDSLPIVPCLVDVEFGLNDIPFEIFNSSDTTLRISKGDCVANIFQVSLQNSKDAESSKFLDAFDLSHLSDEDEKIVKSVLVKNRDVFALNVQEMGSTKVIEHRIDLYDDTPFREKLRPIPPGLYDELRDYLNELVSAGIIRKSKSLYASNIVCVRKTDGSMRVCQDFRKLNLLTIPDSYTIPRVETIIDSLKGAKYFATLDLFSGYYQVAVHEDHIERTAFVTPCGLYECPKMPMGARNSQATFQRLMDYSLDGLILSCCAVYLDDIIVYGKSKEELLQNLQKVFDRLRQNNLRLKPKKCKILHTEISFLGFTVSAEGVKCNDKHIEDVVNWAVPRNVHELQIFLGLANFLRKFVSGFAQIAAPLTKLLRGHTNGKKRGKSRSNRVKSSDSEPAPWEWGVEQQNSFDSLKAL